MRDFKSMKRQRGRNRGGGSSGGGQPNKQNANRAFESNGPENLKVRGHAQHVYEKYQQLARDAASASDRVLAENFLQHAEHYYRVLRLLQPQRPASDFVSRDPFTSGFDAEIDDFPEGAAEAETQSGGGEPQSQGGDAQGEVNGERYDRDGRRYERDREFRGDRDRPERQEREFRDRDRGEREYRERDRQERDRPYEARRDRDDRPRPETQSERPQEPRREEGRDRLEGESRGDREARRRDREYPPRERPSGRYGVREDGQPPASAAAGPQSSSPAAQDSDAPRLRSQDGETFEAPAFLAAAAPTPSPSSDSDAEGDVAPARKRAPRRRKTEDAPVAAETDEG